MSTEKLSEQRGPDGRRLGDLDPYAAMLDAEERYRAALIDEYGENASEARRDPLRATATARLFDCRMKVVAAQRAYYAPGDARIEDDL